MNYYEIHEKAYQKLKEQGHESWDQFLGQSSQFEETGFKTFWEYAVKQSSFSIQNPMALELGCGTGPGSCFLANLGFIVDGIDISMTAVEVAREQAKKRNLNIKYNQSDICKDKLQKNKYDLIVDAHCMHCIATQQDRTFAFQNIQNALKPEGYFWLSTMLGNDTTTFKDSSLWDTDGILWTKASASSDFKSKKEIDGSFYIPHRRVYRDHKRLENELVDAGFKIVYNNIDDDTNSEHPGLYQAICQLA
ncbi:MAG: class I SAM-dependent methyltransferase [Candidatus Cloacimonetes bacterium]|nr:class I SAM-dependent methyltransferase [Candidatus Cloacimonadota bacterium]